MKKTFSIIIAIQCIFIVALLVFSVAQKAEADRQRQVAEDYAKEAQEQTIIADHNAQVAEEQRAIAEHLRAQLDSEVKGK